MTKHTSQKGSALVWIIVLVVVAIGIYYVAKHNAGNTPVNEEASTTPTSNQVSILVPSNIEAYKTEMAQFVQVGGADPVPKTTWVPTIVTPNTVTADPARNAAEAAAEYIQTQAGTSSLIAYFKVVNGTAYVLLTFDLNGWAGVSVAQAEVHPLIEKALLNQPGITAVKFGYAPGDSSQREAAQSSTSDWKTFSNAQYKFSVLVPKNAAIDGPYTQKGLEVRITLQGKQVRRLVIDTVDAPVSYNSACNTSAGGNATTKTINGVAFNSIDVSRLYSSSGINTSATEYCVTHNKIGYQIVPQIPYGQNPPLDVSADADLNTMVKSFTFTN